MEELTLDALLERINSDDPDVRTAAWLGAGAVGAPAVIPLAAIVAKGEKSGAKARARQLTQRIPLVRRKVSQLREQVVDGDKDPLVKEMRKQLAELERELDMLLECPRAAKRAMWKIVRTVGAPGRDTCKASVEAELIRLLADGQPDAVRREAFWMLSEIGGEKTIEAIREIPDILENKAIREDARCCVERIPCEAAVEALRDGLEEAPADFALALAQSLRARGVEVDKQRYPCQKLVPTRETKVKPVEG